MDIRSIILGFLNYREMSGYDIKQYFTHQVGMIYDASYGTIYPTLRKLEQEELVSKREIMQVGKPNKILYSITPKGKEEFRKEIFTPIHAPIVRSDMLVRLFFAGLLPSEEQLVLVDQSLKFQKDLQKDLVKTYASLEELDPYQQLCWEYTLSHMENAIRFFEAKKHELPLSRESVKMNKETEQLMK